MWVYEGADRSQKLAALQVGGSKMDGNLVQDALKTADEGGSERWGRGLGNPCVYVCGWV